MGRRDQQDRPDELARLFGPVEMVAVRRISTGQVVDRLPVVDLPFFGYMHDPHYFMLCPLNFDPEQAAA